MLALCISLQITKELREAREATKRCDFELGSDHLPVCPLCNWFFGDSGLDFTQAAYYRAMNWHGFDYAKNLFSWFGGDEGKNRGPDGTNWGSWGPHWETSSTYGQHVQLSRLDPMDCAFELFQRHKPSYVSGHPAILLELAHEAQTRKVQIALSCATTFGSHVTPEIRDTCQRVFGAKIFDRYASKEVYDIALQYPETGNMHISSELMIFEVLDENGMPCEYGQSGRAIVTPFYNTAQPLVRYELGDMVTLSEKCTCGRSLPAITSLDGRTLHLFRLPGGRRFALRLPYNLKKSILATEWQVAQVGLEAVEVRYIKQADAPSEAFIQLEELLRSQMTRATAVRFLPMKKLSQTPSARCLKWSVKWTRMALFPDCGLSRIHHSFKSGSCMGNGHARVSAQRSES